MEKVKLPSICEIIMGQSPKGDSYNSNKEGYPLLNGAADYKGQNFNPKKFTTKPTKLTEKGDVIFGIRATIGNFAFADKQFCIGRGIAALRVNEDKAEKNYIIRIVKNELSKIIHRAAGSTIKGIKKEDLTEMLINLPPLPTQKKIASILDEADTLRQLNKQLITKYDALTQSLFLEMFGDPVANPMGWEKVELNEVTNKIGSGSTPRGGKESYREHGISLIRSLNIYDNKFKYEKLAHISDEQAEKLKNVIVEENDVLFNITGASICRSTIVPKDVLPARVNQHVSILRPKKGKLNPLFLSHFLISENVKNKLLGVGLGGGAVMQAITKQQLIALEVLIPPINLQNQFAERVAVIEQQKAQAQQSLQKSEDLFNSLLQNAFKGELVK
ncbi:restriction endonuclease subunit S [Psychroserpens sp. Hel_I_66]|uniref:restriction endonuclease subunit S n=1 Tax=Psychroserpens sp. Hel_I_66 TaxID=1250004 RepID=UPI0009DE413D|nr:restriction endonuclease subunit S [Psychroserpens sp. Hel_I_66]